MCTFRDANQRPPVRKGTNRLKVVRRIEKDGIEETIEKWSRGVEEKYFMRTVNLYFGCKT